ncbi:Predicted transcriptional regulator, contains HTH domain [Cellulosimicrobium aquatile]|uniref:Predicted transcriptional regulator, contains HTH domain n=2 Tax=Cellulosimicrobium aquatile TaxID=1612203 RepID=A0A1N6NBV2_9MICO|nr:Predicted transcriptional regulator, contains HTH domain [Cellulosimicrobium aquatile]
MANTSPSEDERLLAMLCREPREAPWLEFKVNNSNPDEIGEYVSALANGAALEGRAKGYLVWGVSDVAHQLVGTEFDPRIAKKGNEDLEPWLTRLLTPQVSLRFRQVAGVGVSVWILEIGAARSSPVAFSGTEWIRVSSYKKRLSKHPELERKLWRTFERETFETGVAESRATAQEVLQLLDYSSYFSLLGTALPTTQRGILDHLAADKLVVPSDVGWSVTNLGAALFARNLRDFPTLSRKRVRVIQYRGDNRVDTIHEQEGERGYASAFEGLVEYIKSTLPRAEAIEGALRVDQSVYPAIAIRELVANMLIHQDFSFSGAGPMVEVFRSRIEITNPGAPIVDYRRFLDLPPHSRNEALAAMMRRVRIAEERGSGWDKVAFAVEYHQLPAPRVEVTDQTRAVLLAPRALTRMDREDRSRAVYLHSCLKQVSDEYTTNATVRERFGIPDGSSAQASKLLNEALEDGLITVFDPDAGYRARRYVPFWAADESIA